MTSAMLLRRWLTLTSWLTVGTAAWVVGEPRTDTERMARILRQAGAVIETRGRARVVLVERGG